MKGSMLRDLQTNEKDDPGDSAHEGCCSVICQSCLLADFDSTGNSGDLVDCSGIGKHGQVEGPWYNPSYKLLSSSNCPLAIFTFI